MNNRLTHAALALALPLAAAAQNVMTIGELFERVEQSSHALKESKAAIDVATHAVEEAKSQRLPDIGASLALSYNGNVLMTDRDFSNAHGISQPHFGNSFALEASQAVYAGGALTAGIRMAELQRERAETGVEQSRGAQRFTALGQYLDLYRLANAIRVYEQNIALTAKLIADIEAKHAEGMALKNDVTRYELQMEQLRLGLRRMEDQRLVANHRLCNTLGMDDAQDIRPDTTIIYNVYAREGEAAWAGRAATMSPTVRQGQLGVEVAEQQLKLSRSEMLPKVGLFAVDNFSGPFTYDIPPIDKNFNIWQVGVGVKYSLSSLFKANKGVRRAKAALAQSREVLQATAEGVDNQMQEAHTLYEQAYATLRTQEKSTELARQNYRVVSERYLSQLALITDMLDASNIRLDAELKEVDARIGIVFAYYRMKFIAGDI